MKTRRLADSGAHRALTQRELPVAPAPRTPPVDPLVSAQLGEFVIQERIGAGGMGVVYRAVHPLIGKQAAIKVLRAELVSRELEQRLLMEARSANAIRHPGILDIFNFGTLPDGRPYVVMELLQGQSLADVLRARGRLDVGTALWILEQILSALGAAHRAGVVHRDLKPANVFVVERPDAAPVIKLVDFGIAKVMRSREGLTLADGSVLGTPDFMAPEQVRGGAVKPATDLYALGIMAFQMLTGTRPFQGENVQVMFAHVEQIPPPPSSRVDGIPPALDALVLQLLEKDPEQRPASAEQVRQRILALSRKSPPGTALHAVPVKPAREEPTSPTTPRPPGLAAMLADRRRRVPLAAAVGVALLGAGLWLLTRTEAPTRDLKQRLPMPPAPVTAPAPPAKSTASPGAVQATTRQATATPPPEAGAPPATPLEGPLKQERNLKAPSRRTGVKTGRAPKAPQSLTAASSSVKSSLEQRLEDIRARLPSQNGVPVLDKDLRDDLSRIQDSVRTATSAAERGYLDEALDLWERRRAERMAARPTSPSR
ncbi:serine/threonine-protein kinase [Corallococcus sp. Z5C101001]|uniref:serine/threonine-protein kinase n=1 Tax=Corallococcus sp. Z5C101001 TaxID=2596829 RepID=UPI00117BEE67|nr:serine/threonine-protein kinase [Corallococcus sp. Z5C101001]TSC32777.1 serine/threonine protein kinase [Corallococcus sp. Z5C101001]